MFKIFWIATIIYTIVFSVAARVNVPTCRLTRAQFSRVCNRFKFFSALPFFFSSAVFIICIFIMKSNSTSENFDRLIYSFCFWWITLATTPICLVNANAYLLRLEQLKKLIQKPASLIPKLQACPDHQQKLHKPQFPEQAEFPRDAYIQK